MTSPFRAEARFASSDEIFHFNSSGKLEKTTVYLAPICPSCNRQEHLFKFESTSVWCCSHEDCMDSRLSNAGCKSLTYPINFIGHLKKKNNFSSATLEVDGTNDDFIAKWSDLKKGKIKDIIIHGPMGVGKTYCMYAALRDVCKTAPQFSSVILTETELYEKIKNTWIKDSKITEEGMIKKFSSVDFLFLDDLGAPLRTIQGDWGKQILLDILDERLNSLTHRTIISTNLPLEDIEKIYNPRISDRIRFMKQSFIGGISKRKPFESNE